MEETIVKDIYYTLNQLRVSIDSWCETLLREPDSFDPFNLESLSSDIDGLLERVKKSKDKIKVEDENDVSEKRKNFEKIFDGNACKNFIYKVFKGDRLIYTSLGTEKFPDDYKPKLYHDGARIGTSYYGFIMWKYMKGYKAWKRDCWYAVNFYNTCSGFYYQLSWEVSHEDD